LIRKVGDEALNNMLNPGYPVEVLDLQIKKIYKNLTLQRRMKRRKIQLANLQIEQQKSN